MTCCAGSIPSELGKLSALQGLILNGRLPSGGSDVSETFVASDGGDVSNGIHDVGRRKWYLFGIIAGNLFSSYGFGLFFRRRWKTLDTLVSGKSCVETTSSRTRFDL